MQRLNERGIGCAVYYPVPFHEQKCFAGLPSCDDAFPVADEVSRDILALPVYPELTEDMQHEVVDALG
jgi:UDP-2-acetamido-2-deoxy-ribo-hexuluronate aminotransferase